MSALAGATGPISTVWEVLTRNAREFVQIMQAYQAVIDMNAHRSGPLSDEDIEEVEINRRHLIVFCQDAKLTTSERVITTQRIDPSPMGVVHALISFMTTFHAELDARKVYFLTSRWRDLYDQRENPFGAAVDDAFPSIRREIREAANCLAVDRYTAAVMHLMRSTELPFKLLCDAVGVPFTHAAGEKVLNDIRANIKVVASGGAKPPGWKQDEKFYSDAEAHLRAFKDAWRNYAMHLHDTYSEEEASAIWHSVKAFMTGVAGRLHE